MPERISGYNPERALPESGRINLDMITGYWEGAATALKGTDLDMVVRQGLISLLKDDLRNY
jgi:hypothetical protein